MPIQLTTTEASETWRSVMTAFTRVNSVLAEEMEAETEITLDWYSILLMLSQVENEMMRPSDLADYLGMSRSGTTRLIDRLERDGLVQRRSCGSDRRGTFVGLTPKGEEQFRKAGRIHLRGINEHVGSHLSADEMADLRTILTKLSQGVNRDELAVLSRADATP